MDSTFDLTSQVTMNMVILLACLWSTSVHCAGKVWCFILSTFNAGTCPTPVTLGTHYTCIHGCIHFKCMHVWEKKKDNLRISNYL